MEHGAVLSGATDKKQMMMAHIKAVADSIVSDQRGDAVFERYLRQVRHAHSYSMRNLMLIDWQAPDSRFVASLSAFEEIAEEQGIPTVDLGGRPRRVRQARGARAIWILGGKVVRRNGVGDETGEEQTLTDIQFFPCKIWAGEEIVCAVDGRSLELPDFVQRICDDGLYECLLAFAAVKGIDVRDSNLGDARGVSTIGTILLQKGDPLALRIHPLIHELAHELLHDLTRRRTMPTPLKEGEAEATAAVVLRALGHDVPMSAAYLRNHGVRASDILSSMDRIGKAANEILDAVAQGKAGAMPRLPGSPGELRREVGRSDQLHGRHGR